MKLNLDCLRSVLQKAEEIPFDHTLKLVDLYDELPDYSKDDVHYSCIKLYEAGMITASIIDVDNLPIFHVHSIIDITFKGHEFHAKIKDDSRWKGIKKALPAIRDYSLDAINAVANGFASTAITAYLSRPTP